MAKPWCYGEGTKGLNVRGQPKLDRCPVCDAVFVKYARMRIPKHREGKGDVSLESRRR